MEKIEEYLNELKSIANKKLSLDMSRGKPSSEQLDLSMPMLDVLSSDSSLYSEQGYDCRNYGVLDGLDECKALMSELLKVDKNNVIVFGNSSLNIMYECIANAMLFGINGSTPWSQLKTIKWLCPVPGYDRHFAITEHFKIEMINIPINSEGPDMNLVEEYVKDPDVKGIWCVPMYGNPTGITFSDEIVKRFANLRPVSKDFRIYWDNAYCIHHLYKNKQDHLLNIYDECKSANNEDLVYIFASTSKISFPGSGIAALGASPNNIKDIKQHLKYKTIGYDKVNQMRHVRFFNNLNGLKEQMIKHSEILGPKFDLVLDTFKKELDGFATWSKPNGGYFISLYVKGCAKEVVERCKSVGLTLTDAGAAYPYHYDKDNSHIRIAPSYLSMDELKLAIPILCLCVKVETLSRK